MATLDAGSTTGYGATTTAVCTVDSNQIAEGSVGCATAMEDDNKSSAQQIAWERGGGEHDTMRCDARVARWKVAWFDVYDCVWKKSIR